MSNAFIILNYIQIKKNLTIWFSYIRLCWELLVWIVAVQSQTAVTAYFSSKRILHFGFAEQ